MNSCLESHYPDDVLERYAMGRLLSPDHVPLEEHLLICPTCQTHLLAVEEYILVARAALAAPQNPARIGAQSAWYFDAPATPY